MILSIKTRMIAFLMTILILLGICISIFGYYSIKQNIVERAQKQMRTDLKAAQSVYNMELEIIRKGFELIDHIDNPTQLKMKLGLDYLFVVERENPDTIRSQIVRRAFSGNGTGGTRIIDSIELRRMGEDLYRKALITLQSTPKARPTSRKHETNAMAMEYAVPYFNQHGQVERVLYGGKIINRSFNLVDKIHNIVYENKLYKGKPIGTVTIFLDDVRITTNVVNQQGGRAIGTRVSESVYHNVVEKGVPWCYRAFVVTDWYLTAYEPIRDIAGNIIGIFYVGILEQPFNDLIHATFIVFIAIMGACTIVAIVLAFLLAGSIITPLTRLVHATASLAEGDLSYRIPNKGTVKEIHVLAESFNHMAHKLAEREQALTRTNEELDVVNRRYIDLIGMVSHELKGILSSTVLNVYSLRDGYLGEINEKQKKALNSVTRNLEYFDLSVKNFLNLSRIEKGELSLSRSDFQFKEDIVEPAVDAFSRQAIERNMSFRELVPTGITVNGDNFLILTVMNNLLSNAIKYGVDNGCVTISTAVEDAVLRVEVVNTGRTLTTDEVLRLFQRFSRLANVGGKKVRGTGLGLFLCKEIIERHGGSIWCEPREQGNAFLFQIPVKERK